MKILTFDIPSWAVWVAAGALAVLLIVVLRRILRRKEERAPPSPEDRRIDVERLTLPPVEPGGPRLTLRGVPMRLGVVITAPAGHGGFDPPAELLPVIFEEIQPGLAEVFRSDAPRTERWPAQISAQGFTGSFFKQVRLPGDAGRGTPWCAVAGRIEFRGEPLLLGVALQADRPNSLGQLAVEEAGAWYDLFRIRSEE